MTRGFAGATSYVPEALGEAVATTPLWRVLSQRRSASTTPRCWRCRAAVLRCAEGLWAEAQVNSGGPDLMGISPQ